MSSFWDNDDELLAELGAAVRAEAEVPARFVEAGRAAFAWRTVDAELASLTYDSATDGVAGVRAEPADLRALTFAARGLTIELEVTEDSLIGQVVAPQAGSVEVLLRDGSAGSVEIDEVGWFTIRPRPSGLFRLRVTTADGTAVLTEWVTV
jgi:hypothetical protein